MASSMYDIFKKWKLNQLCEVKFNLSFKEIQVVGCGEALVLSC